MGWQMDRQVMQTLNKKKAHTDRVALADETGIWEGQSHRGQARDQPKQPHSPTVLPCMGHTSIKPEAPGTHRVLGQDTLRAALETAAVAGVHLCYLGRGAHQEPTLQKWSQEGKRATSSRLDHDWPQTPFSPQLL